MVTRESASHAARRGGSERVASSGMSTLAPGSQVGPHLPGRGVEGDTGDEGCAVLGCDLVGPLMPADQVRQAAVWDRDTFWLAGRA